MTASPAPVILPPPPLPDAGPDRSPLLHAVTLPVAPGLIETPPLGFHAIDLHLGDPVQASCRIDGREQRGLQSEGLYCVMPAGMTSRWLMARSARALLILLAPSLLQQTADAMGLRGASAELAPSIYVRDPQIERLAWILQAEHEDGCPSGALFSDSLATALAARLLGLQAQRGAPAEPARRALPGRRLGDVVDYIEAHLDEDLSLAELAAVAGFSVSHFKPLFKQAVGLPVHRYVIERRVQRARALVLEGRRSLVEIALDTGFAHPSHMARCMRRMLGVSPSQLATSAMPRAVAPPRR